jgi:hypothetical protein
MPAQSLEPIVIIGAHIWLGGGVGIPLTTIICTQQALLLVENVNSSDK